MKLTKCLAVMAASVLVPLSAQEKEWNFTWFGQSSNENYNTFEMLNKDENSFRLNSCTYDESTGKISKKGGKFTKFHDGISYYYTVINPEAENFELSATVKVDYINSTPDGQEGFGILAMDSLGEDKNSAKNHYTNSAGILSWKYETNIDGVKYSVKDGLGSRFVYGMTPSILASGDAAIADNCTQKASAFSYDADAKIKTGSTYKITLKKDNTGYHAIYNGIDQLVYDNENEKLRQLDKDHVYLGFVVARGVNATFTDVSLKITDPKTDAPAIPEPPTLVPLTHAVTSKAYFYSTDYDFKYLSNCDGTLTVKDAKGKALISDAAIVAKEEFQKTLKLKKAKNNIVVEFTPNKDYKPAVKHAIAQFNSEKNEYEENYSPVTDEFTVEIASYGKDAIYVSQNGNAKGKGTEKKPVDIHTAVRFNKPGQKIVLASGKYEMKESLIIERGNNGTDEVYNILTTADGKQAVLDFGKASAGVVTWGDYWTIEHIDVTNTKGDTKGMQVGGSNNVVRYVNTYSNGDTGLQISGSSADSSNKWPKNNLIEFCTSYDNCDPAQNNADGFAAKITCGEGNIFRYCIAYSNIDDGWDLFSKIETGPIGVVIIENSIAYRNGSRLDGSGHGDGNGFKMGGDGINVPHILRNSLSYENGANGVTSNSNPGLQIENVTAYGNKSSNIALYGKDKKAARKFKASGVISMAGAGADTYNEQPELLSESTYFFDGTASKNSNDVVLDDSIFESTNTKERPSFTENGIDLHKMFVLNKSAPADAGARF